MPYLEPVTLDVRDPVADPGQPYKQADQEAGDSVKKVHWQALARAEALGERRFIARALGPC